MVVNDYYFDKPSVFLRVSIDFHDSLIIISENRGNDLCETPELPTIFMQNAWWMQVFFH
jgi:hypothetical protein